MNIVKQLKQLEQETFQQVIGDYGPDSNVGLFLAEEVWHGVINSLPDYLGAVFYALKYPTFRTIPIEVAEVRAKEEGYVPELQENTIEDILQRLEVYVLLHPC